MMEKKKYSISSRDESINWLYKIEFWRKKIRLHEALIIILIMDFPPSLHSTSAKDFNYDWVKEKKSIIFIQPMYVMHFIRMTSLVEQKCNNVKKK